MNDIQALVTIEELVNAVQSAGAYMVSIDANTNSTEKSNTKDFVTVADIKSQDILRSTLQANHSDLVILSEEDDEAERAAMYDANFTGVILDPIDGTYNYKRGMQESGISAGLIASGEMIAGVILDPYKNELFTVEKGNGAYLNGKPIHVSSQTELRGASVATSNGYDDAAAARNLQRQLKIYEQTSVMPWSSLQGSAVLVMAWLACGRIDAFHHNGLKPWDNAAAFLLICEAGGIVEKLEGGEASFTDACVLIGTPAIQQQLRTIFDQIPSELLR